MLKRYRNEIEMTESISIRLRLHITFLTGYVSLHSSFVLVQIFRNLAKIYRNIFQSISLYYKMKSDPRTVFLPTSTLRAHRHTEPRLTFM